MKVFALLLVCVALFGTARADGRAGVVEWSDGHKQAGAISLTAGKSLRVFSGGQQVSITLDEVKEIRFTGEKEEMWEGFYFPNAGQATQAKTGEVYPIRYIKAEVALGNGQVVTGHLNTTVFYVEDDRGMAQKVVVEAKQSGTNGEKLAELLYPTAIRFDAGAVSSGGAVIDLTSAGLTGAQAPIFLTQPDLTLLAAQQAAGKPVWTVPTDNPAKLLFSVVAADGIHVAWPPYVDAKNPFNIQSPKVAQPLADVDPVVHAAVETGLHDLRDFYDSRILIGSFAGEDPTDIYSLVMMKRLAKSVDGGGTPTPDGVVPWSLVILRWKYDADTKKVTLLNRAMLAIGRIDPQTPEPKVIRDPGMLRDITGSK